MDDHRVRVAMALLGLFVLVVCAVILSRRNDPKE